MFLLYTLALFCFLFLVYHLRCTWTQEQLLRPTHDVALQWQANTQVLNDEAKKASTHNYYQLGCVAVWVWVVDVAATCCLAARAAVCLIEAKCMLICVWCDCIHVHTYISIWCGVVWCAVEDTLGAQQVAKCAYGVVNNGSSQGCSCFHLQIKLHTQQLMYTSMCAGGPAVHVLNIVAEISVLKQPRCKKKKKYSAW